MAEHDVVSGEPADTATDEELQEDGDAGTDADDSQDADEDGVVVTIGEESPPPEESESAPEWVRTLRKSNREKDAELKRLREQVAQANQPAPATVVGPKPTLEACEFDAEKFERDLEAWHERKRTADAEETTKRTAAENANKAWQARLDHHSKLKSELKVKDFDEVDAILEDAMTVPQRGLIVHGADNSAVVFYALAKNPAKLKELASIQDPVKFAFAVAKLETQLKVTPRRTAPIPERTVRGTARGVVDNQLAKLEADADKTGDRSKVAEYRRQKREAGRK